MLRFNLFLLLAVIVSALGVVTAQHRSTRLFQAIQAENTRAEQLDIEFNQLKADLYHLAAHARVTEFAHERLHMRAPQVGMPSASLVPEASASEGGRL